MKPVKESHLVKMNDWYYLLRYYTLHILYQCILINRINKNYNYNYNYTCGEYFVWTSSSTRIISVYLLHCCALVTMDVISIDCFH
jgi:hypothetical protein